MLNQSQPQDAEGRKEAQLLRSTQLSTSARIFGVICPVLLATTFCLTVPAILVIADGAILVAALAAFLGERSSRGAFADEPAL